MVSSRVLFCQDFTESPEGENQDEMLVQSEHTLSKQAEECHLVPSKSNCSPSR